MNVIDLEKSDEGSPMAFDQNLNQRKFLCKYDQISFKIAKDDSSLDSGIKSRTLRNSGTNIEPRHSSRVQKIVFPGRMTRKEAR
jgi:hypothetical protein